MWLLMGLMENVPWQPFSFTERYTRDGQNGKNGRALSASFSFTPNLPSGILGILERQCQLLISFTVKYRVI